ACAWPLALMLVAGVVMAELAQRLGHRPPHPAKPIRAEHGNPFRIQPALRFGALFSAVVFLSQAASAQAGAGAFLGPSLLGGLVDVATVVAPASDLLKANQIPLGSAELAVLLALGANALLKIVLAGLSGTWRFAIRIAMAFVLWGAMAAVGFWAGSR